MLLELKLKLQYVLTGLIMAMIITVCATVVLQKPWAGVDKAQFIHHNLATQP